MRNPHAGHRRSYLVAGECYRSPSLVQGGQGRTAAEVSASAGHVLAALAGAAVGLGLMFLTGVPV